MSKKNIVYWCGVKPEDDRVSTRFKYGDYEWMEYSKKTWEYWCKKNGVEFVHYDKPSRPDQMRYKINWQRWFDIFDYIGDDYKSVLTVDASIMIRWDCPNLFDLASWGTMLLRNDENWRWTYESAKGYEDMFPDVKFSHKDYFASGFFMFNRKSAYLIEQLKEFFFEHEEEILKREDETVLRGRDQPILNYIVQRDRRPMTHWDVGLVGNHLYRKEVLQGNWQLNDPMPFFIKYFKVWIFSGFSDRGETRTRLMKSTWDIVKENYV